MLEKLEELEMLEMLLLESWKGYYCSTLLTFSTLTTFSFFPLKYFKIVKANSLYLLKE